MVNATVLRYKTNKANKKRLPERKSPSFFLAESIGILFTVEDMQKHNAVKKFIDSLNMENKKVSTLCYLPKGKDNYEFIFDYFIKKEVSFLGNINNDAANQFIHQKFDFLFLLDQKINPLTKFILANSEAKCRVGVPLQGNENFLEFMIKPRSKTFDIITEDFLTYIKKIK